ncbi:1-acyl-sn-glycerol-3-phosphate acyltransferase [Marmoricola sp. OAE513]|uniref:lysophospholipid acyltransferase family protein n=1 Tax=Marmoricola sp. OAE513 TaxID=2817894 RepID=UPI001AE29ED7
MTTVDRTYKAINALGRLALRALDVRVHPHGLENLPATGPVVLAANHVSYLDFIMIEKAAVDRARYVRFMTRYDVWKPGPIAWAMDRMGHIPVDRTVPVAAYLRARRLLQSGQAVGVFPEAGISYSFTVRSLMRGAVALARETGAPLVPVAIWGSQRIFSVGVPEPPPDLTRGRRVDIEFGAPWQVPPGADLIAETQRLGATLTGMLEGLQRMPEHVPRPGEHATWYPAHLGGHAPTREEARALDVVPTSAVTPTWWPPAPEVRSRAGSGAGPDASPTTRSGRRTR